MLFFILIKVKQLEAQTFETSQYFLFIHVFYIITYFCLILCLICSRFYSLMIKIKLFYIFLTLILYIFNQVPVFWKILEFHNLLVHLIIFFSLLLFVFPPQRTIPYIMRCFYKLLLKKKNITSLLKNLWIPQDFIYIHFTINLSY